MKAEKKNRYLLMLAIGLGFVLVVWIYFVSPFLFLVLLGLAVMAWFSYITMPDYIKKREGWEVPSLFFNRRNFKAKADVLMERDLRRHGLTDMNDAKKKDQDFRHQKYRKL